MIASDMMIMGSLGMFASFFAIYVEDFIAGGNEAVIGIAFSIYLFSRSILQIPIATYIDRVKGENDDYFLLVFFTILAGLTNIAFLFINQVWQLYILEMLFGLFTAITYPSYMAIYTHHIDPNMEGTEWGLYYSLVDLSGAVLAALGGYIAENFGINYLVIIVTIMCVSGGLFLIPLRKYHLIQKKKFGIF